MDKNYCFLYKEHQGNPCRCETINKDVDNFIGEFLYFLDYFKKEHNNKEPYTITEFTLWLTGK